MNPSGCSTPTSVSYSSEAPPTIIPTSHSSVISHVTDLRRFQASSPPPGSSHLLPVQAPPPRQCPALMLPIPSPLQVIPSPLPRAPSPGPAVLSPLPAVPCRRSVDSGPDLECSICFSPFNNVFRCPKLLRCRHTFCLECLARINVKSAEPDAVQCPLCRRLTPLPALGPPRLATDRTVLSYLPTTMQRVYSVRFVRNKGKLQVKRSSEGQRSLDRSLDVGIPSPPLAPHGSTDVGQHRARPPCVMGRSACRAFLFTCVVLMVLLMGIIIFLLIFHSDTRFL